MNGLCECRRLVRLRTPVKIPILKWHRKSFISVLRAKSFVILLLLHHHPTVPFRNWTAMSVSIVHQIGFISGNSAMKHISLMSLFFLLSATRDEMEKFIPILAECACMCVTVGPSHIENVSENCVMNARKSIWR